MLQYRGGRWRTTEWRVLCRKVRFLRSRSRETSGALAEVSRLRRQQTGSFLQSKWRAVSPMPTVSNGETGRAGQTKDAGLSTLLRRYKRTQTVNIDKLPGFAVGQAPS